jgi:hypothetical protein
LEAYRKHRARNIQAFEALGPAGMAKPTKAPPKGLEEALGTIGQTFMIVALHQMSHLGQVADARRSLGRAPLFVFPE